jgi:hypothetical protein
VVRVEGGPFKQNGGGGVEKRPVGDVGVAGDPADVRGAPVDVLIFLGWVGALSFAIFNTLGFCDKKFEKFSF